MAQLKPGVKKGLKFIGYAALILIVGGGIYKMMHASKKVAESQKIDSAQLGTAAESSQAKTTDTKIDLPDFDNPVTDGTPIKWQVMAWNSQFPLMYANGGVHTSKNSLMNKAGVNINIIRQDDCNKTIADFIANANELKKNPNATPMIMSFMGDGVPGFSVMLNKLKDLGPDYVPIVFYHMGRSNGEDQFMAPPSWKSNPKNALGKCVAGVERDGDLNIVFKWAADNNIPINAQTKYIDRNALNIIPAADFIEAGNKYITGYTEKRTLIRDGRTIPDSVIEVQADAVTTWTPGDVNVAEKKGGLVRIASTHEYTSQMPNASIVLKSWAQSHVSQMKGIIAALGQAGDQVRSFPEAQAFAAKVSAKVYGDQDKPADYWLKYWRGVTQKDATGNQVQLGGSQAFNLADAANMVGMGNDHIDRYKITYETFAHILEKLYPTEMKDWIPYSKMMDKSYLTMVLTDQPELTKGGTEEDKQTYSSEITDQVSSKSYNIQFDLGKATIKPASFKQLDEIFNSAVVSGGLSIGVYGHTDNTGNADANQTLSEQRAQAVSDYLQKKGLDKKRINVKGYGDTQPVYGDASDPRNRCVQIVQGS